VEPNKAILTGLACDTLKPVMAFTVKSYNMKLTFKINQNPRKDRKIRLKTLEKYLGLLPEYF